MTWIDILILLPLLWGLIRGLMKGFIVEIMAIIALALGFLGARLWGAAFASWMLHQFAWPEAVCNIVAYALLFLGIALALNIVGKLLTKLFKSIHIGWVNRLVGGLFGMIKWAVVVLFVVLCVHRLDEEYHFFKPELKSRSIIYEQTAPLSEKMMEKLKSEMAEHAHTVADTVEKVKENI